MDVPYALRVKLGPHAKFLVRAFQTTDHPSGDQNSHLEEAIRWRTAGKQKVLILF